MNRNTSESWRVRDRRVLWHPFTAAKSWLEEEFPVIESAQGATLVDADGKRYLDGCASLAGYVHGHRKPALESAILGQLEEFAQVPLQGLTHRPGIELAEALVALAPLGLTRVFYTDGGSSAVEAALKMALRYWQCAGSPQKVKFVSLSDGYHGDSLGAVSVGGIDRFSHPFKPLLFQTIKAPNPYAYRCPKTSVLEECAKHCIEEMEGILRTHARETAAVLVEPMVQGVGGILVQPPGFTASLRSLCDKHDVLLIADEASTAFGRTGRMFACEHEKVTPDLLTTGKALTGGLVPLGAMLTTGKVHDALAGEEFPHGGGSPLACAAGLASLRIFQKEKTLERLRPKVHWLANALQDFYEIPQVGDIRNCGLIVGIELVRDPKTKEPYSAEARMGHRVVQEARKQGAILRALRDVVVLMPPLGISMGDLKALVRIALAAIRSAIGSET